MREGDVPKVNHRGAFVKRVCLDKVRHATYGSAKRHRNRLGRVDDDEMTIYWCRFCGGFHLGHKTDI